MILSPLSEVRLSQLNLKKGYFEAEDLAARKTSFYTFVTTFREAQYVDFQLDFVTLVDQSGRLGSLLASCRSPEGEIRLSRFSLPVFKLSVSVCGYVELYDKQFHWNRIISYMTWHTKH